MPLEGGHPTLLIDAQALAANWRTMARMAPSAEVAAAVKADCYGLGVDACVPHLVAAGARHFLVAHWLEVEDVARHVPPARISVLHGPVCAADVAIARRTGARPVINSLAQAQRWVQAGGGPCDLMIDTGINRLGLRPDEVRDPVVGQLDIEVLMSHLACADEDSPRNAQQQSLFTALLSAVAHRRASLANSAGVALGASYHLDVVRPGLALYGGVPRRELAGRIAPVATLAAPLVQRRRVRQGEGVGYNGTFAAPRDMDIGIVSLGYADGLLRVWGGSGALHFDGRELAMVGRISMDMLAVDLTCAPDAREGDLLTLAHDVPAAAHATGLSQYEVLTTLGRRMPRRTVRGSGCTAGPAGANAAQQ
ncbi:alanine racemase [Erythrobacteraceae bacterium CFH 75059]|uniref:alanine racemase n=1 Tax=Qipengyuania thermophila TaxID=2509361 RepID=UPI00101F5554|nr:alanine racemase [Qipengyuania thermophila]TCD05191.1 alanine racemase [Erythrobacteraceae bacterium CFH 75059]